MKSYFKVCLIVLSVKDFQMKLWIETIVLLYVKQQILDFHFNYKKQTYFISEDYHKLHFEICTFSIHIFLLRKLKELIIKYFKEVSVMLFDFCKGKSNHFSFENPLQIIRVLISLPLNVFPVVRPDKSLPFKIPYINTSVA